MIGLKGMPGTPPWGSLYFTVDNTMSATLMTIILSQILSNVVSGSSPLNILRLFLCTSLCLCLDGTLTCRPGQVLALVEDTAQNIRVMMRMSGLKPWAYWAASFSMWFSIAMTQSAIFLFFVKVVSLPSGWKLGLLQTTDDSLTFVLVVLAQLNIVSFSFFFSSMLGSIKSALTWGTVFNMARYFILGQISDVFTSTTIPEWIKTILSLLPPMGVFRATVSMTQYNLKSVDPLVDSSPTLGWDSVITGRSPVGEVILILLFEIPVFLFLALWIDQVNPKAHITDPKSQVWEVNQVNLKKRPLETEIQGKHSRTGASDCSIALICTSCCRSRLNPKRASSGINCRSMA